MTSPANDVVFIIEATANLGSYIELLKRNYIIPTLEQFCGYSLDQRNAPSDFSASSRTNNTINAIPTDHHANNDALFALVAYHTASCSPEPATVCIGPTTSAHKLLAWIDNLHFVGGGAENFSHITEGFASALQIFDDFHDMRESTTQTPVTTSTNGTDNMIASDITSGIENTSTNRLNRSETGNGNGTPANDLLSNKTSGSTTKVEVDQQQRNISSGSSSSNNNNDININNGIKVEKSDDVGASASSMSPPSLTPTSSSNAQQATFNHSKANNDITNTDDKSDKDGYCDDQNELSSKQKTSELDLINGTTSSCLASSRAPTAKVGGASRNKHCILICNSPPYQTPCIESPSYFGLSLDCVVGSMRERRISLSIITPRRMSFLFKLFEKAGGDLQSAMSKHYARDARHLVLLRNYQLQERPLNSNSTSDPSLTATPAQPAASVVPQHMQHALNQQANASPGSHQQQQQQLQPPQQHHNQAPIQLSLSQQVSTPIHNNNNNSSVPHTSIDNNNTFIDPNSNIGNNNSFSINSNNTNIVSNKNNLYSTIQASPVNPNLQNIAMSGSMSIAGPNSPATATTNPNYQQQQLVQQQQQQQQSPLLANNQQHQIQQQQQLLNNKQTPSPAQAGQQKNPNSPQPQPSPHYANQQHSSPMAQVMQQNQALMTNKQMPSPASNQRADNSPASTNQNYAQQSHPQQHNHSPMSQQMQQQVMPAQTLINKQMPSPVAVAGQNKGPNSPAQPYQMMQQPVGTPQQQQPVLSPQSPMIQKQMPSPATSQKRPHSPAVTPPSNYSAQSPMAPPQGQQVQLVMRAQPPVGNQLYHKGPNVMIVPKKDDFEMTKRQIDANAQKPKVSLFKPTFEAPKDQGVAFGSQMSSGSSTNSMHPQISQQQLPQQQDLLLDAQHQQQQMQETQTLGPQRNISQQQQQQRGNLVPHPQSPAQPKNQPIIASTSPIQTQQTPQQNLASQQHLISQQQQARIQQQVAQTPMSTFQIISPHQQNISIQLQHQQQQQQQQQQHIHTTNQQAHQIQTSQQIQQQQIQMQPPGQQVLVQQANVPISMTNIGTNYYQISGHQQDLHATLVTTSANQQLSTGSTNAGGQAIVSKGQTIQLTTNQTPPQAKNPLLNASLGPITNNQQQTKTVNFVPNMMKGQQIVGTMNVVTSSVPTSMLGQSLVQSSPQGNSIIVNSQTGTHQVKSIAGGTPVLISDNSIGVSGGPIQPQMTTGGVMRQQPMAIGGQMITNAQIISSQPSVVGQVIQQNRPVAAGPGGMQQTLVRQEHANKIQKLEGELQEARRLEALWQQQEQGQVTQIVQGPQGHVQHHPSQGMHVLRQPTGSQPLGTQQRIITQPRIGMPQQQQQHAQHQQIMLNTPIRQVNVTPNNTQALRSILQQQSQPNVLTRTIGPQQTQTNIGAVRHMRPMMQPQIHTQQHIQQQPPQNAMIQQPTQQPQQPQPGSQQWI